jgi:hypothetical protein
MVVKQCGNCGHAICHGERAVCKLNQSVHRWDEVCGDWESGISTMPKPKLSTDDVDVWNADGKKI